jgi:hypothetical protein
VLHVNVRDPNSDEVHMRSEAQATLDPTTESV